MVPGLPCAFGAAALIGQTPNLDAALAKVGDLPRLRVLMKQRDADAVSPEALAPLLEGRLAS